MLIPLSVLSAVLSAASVGPAAGAATVATHSTLREAITAAAPALQTRGAQLTPPLRRPARHMATRHALSRRLQAIVIGMMAGMVAVGPALGAVEPRTHGGSIQPVFVVIGLGAAGGGILGGLLAR